MAGYPVVFVDAGGLPVTYGSDGNGWPIEEALSGLPVTIVAAGGLPVVEGVGAWSPSALFVDGTTKGAWYDPSDLSTMFQNSNGTTAVAVGDPVGYIADKSGNGFHAIQATAASRPVLRQDAQGRHYLEADGADDVLVASFTAVATDRAMMVLGAQIDTTGATASDDVFTCGNSVNGNPLLFVRRNSTTLQGGWRSLAGADATAVHTITTAADGRHVFTTLASDANASIRMDAVELNVGSGVPASTTLDRIGIFALVRSTVANWAPGRFYGGIIVFREVITAELDNAENYMAELGLNP